MAAVTFDLSIKARIKAALLERRRILTEAKYARAKLKRLAEEKRGLSAQAIADRHNTSLRTVNSIASTLRTTQDENANLHHAD